MYLTGRSRSGNHTIATWIRKLGHSVHLETDVDIDVEPVDGFVIRDVRNWFASFYRFTHVTKVWQGWRAYGPLPRHVEGWAQLAEAALNRPEEYLVVNYNSWVKSEEYRRELARILGVPYSEEGLLDVHWQCGGSSFEGLALDGKADQMPVFDRWRHHFPEEHEDLMTPDVLDLNYRLFGDVYGTGRPSCAEK